MSRNWTAVAKLSLGTALVLAIVTYPVPGRSDPDRSLKVGDAVYLSYGRADLPWEIIAFNPTRDTVVVKRGGDMAMMAIWECTPAE